MPTVRIPLVGSPHSRIALDADTQPGISTLDQRFINFLFKKEANPVTGAARVKAFKRPGIVNGLAIDTAGSEFAVANSTKGVADKTIFSVWGDTGGNTVLASLDTSESSTAAITAPIWASRPVELNVDGTPQLYFHVITSNSANKGAFVSTLADPPVLTAQTDGDLPETTLVGSFAALDGYLFIATSTGEIYNSDLNNDTSWTSTSFLDNSLQQYGRGVFNHKDKIGLFTEETIEFYENVGNPVGSPLQRIDHLTQRSFGLPLPSLTTALDPSQWYLAAFDTVFFINNTRLGSVGVYMLDGFRPRKISSADVDWDLANSDMQDQKIIGFFSMHGMRYIAVDTGDNATQYVWFYCIDLNTWTTFESPLCTGAVQPLIIANDNVTAQEVVTKIIIGATFYQFDTTSALFSDISYTDGGSAFTGTIQTRAIDLDTRKRKFWDRLTLIGSDSREASAVTVSWSDDDGQNWSSGRSLDLNDDRPSTAKLGSSRKRQFRLTSAADAACELEAVELEVRTGTV